MRRPPNRALMLLATVALVAAVGAALSRASGAVEASSPAAPLGKLFGGL